MGVRLGLKGERCASPKCAMVRKPYAPGMHGQKRKFARAKSDFGRQLQEKQKCKLVYGIDERTLRRLFEAAYKKSGSTSENLMVALESRLDNVIFRLGLASSRSMARQLIVHGHVFVNGRRVRAPGFELKTGDLLSVRPESVDLGMFKNLKESLKKYEAPSWLHLDAAQLAGKVLNKPHEESLPFEVNTLVESFSK